MPEGPQREENFSAHFEEGALDISDGMEPIAVPERMTKDEFLSLFGGRLPEGVSPDILGDDDTLELEQ
ncbi:MAG TPA: hypothetical protein VJJ02_02475 [Candidatus Paceibacterota bacterium]